MWTLNDPDKKVRRDHILSISGAEHHEVEGLGKRDIHFITERYNGQVVDSWQEIVKSQKNVQTCNIGNCNIYGLVTVFSKRAPQTPADVFICKTCAIKVRATSDRKQSKLNYKHEFPKRIMAFSRALRKLYPELNSRKSRKPTKHGGNEIIINKVSWDAREDVRKKINILGYEFNLHVNLANSQEDNGYDERMRYTICDISPMFDEHFRDHGHRGGILKRNR